MGEKGSKPTRFPSAWTLHGIRSARIVQPSIAARSGPMVLEPSTKSRRHVMAQTGRMPFRGAATLGRGVNTLTGEIIGKALNIKTTEKAVSGGEAIYDVKITETHD